MKIENIKIGQKLRLKHLTDEDVNDIDNSVGWIDGLDEHYGKIFDVLCVDEECDILQFKIPNTNDRFWIQPCYFELIDKSANPIKPFKKEEIKRDIEEIVSFLNTPVVDINKENEIVYVDIGVKNMGVGGLVEFRKRLELELSFIISNHIYEKLGYSISVIVDIGCN